MSAASPQDRRARTPAALGTRRRSLLVVAALLGGWVGAQDARLEIGVGGNLVVGAWNPLRLVINDAPPGSLLTLVVDQGSLRSGPIPAQHTFPLAGGGGVTVIDERIYVPPYDSITWSVTSAERVLSSGSFSGREQDDRPLDIVVGRRPGLFATVFPGAARVVDLGAAELPLDPSAYGGVRSLIIDGTTTAPRLEAVAAAAGGGAIVVLHGEMPASHAELNLLADGPFTRLGAGAVATTSGAAADAVTAALDFTPLDRGELIAALALDPLVQPPTPLSQTVVLAVAAALGVLVLALLRVFAAPGLVAALLIAGLLSLVGWRALRPTAAELVGDRSLAMAGGALALEIEVREHFTLPAATVQIAGAARPLEPRPYLVDRDGLHTAVPRWRSLLVVRPATITEFPLRLVEGTLENGGSVAFSDIVVSGLGPQGTLAPGARRSLRPTEEGPLPDIYRGLEASLTRGSLLATSGCPQQCTVWLAPDLIAESGAQEPPGEAPEGTL